MLIYDVVFFLVFKEIKKIQAAVMKFLVLCERLGSFRQQVKIYSAYKIKRGEIKCRECM